MKKTIPLVAALALAAGLRAQQPTVVYRPTMPDIRTEQMEHESEWSTRTAGLDGRREVRYSIDGHLLTITLESDAEWRGFMRRIVRRARRGEVVRVGAMTDGAQPAVEVKVYTTRSKRQAARWAMAMVDEGYTVEIAFDEGVYTCVAVK